MNIAENPFYEEFATFNAAPPFDKIDIDCYEAAIDRGIKLALEEVDRITENVESPSFENTIEALERSGSDLNRVLNVFYPLNSAMADDSMMELSVKMMPKLSDYQTSVSLNELLWKRIKTVYDNRDAMNLTPEQSMLLQRTYDSFKRNGALLEGEARAEFKRLSAERDELTTLFGQNVLKELNTYEIPLQSGDLDGLPESLVEAAAHLAKERGYDGKYLFTLSQPTYMSFMKYSSRRDLREKMYRLYMGRNLTGKYSNVDIMKRIAYVRLQIANLLGYATYADYSLCHTMAETPGNVYKLLHELRDAYIEAWKTERAELDAFVASTEGAPMTLQPWDYSFYSNKLRESKYSYDEECLRPYFELNRVIGGVFGLAENLYGVSFVQRYDLPVYHPDVKVFEVRDSDGGLIGLLYADFFPRENKRSGAWMTDFKSQWVDADGKDNRPNVSIVMNFTKPTETKPSLLTPDEVSTFLHEFGHALHGLFSKVRYESLSGTNVYRDFVELPSQFNENFLSTRKFLDSFARHYVTDEPIPQEYVDKIIESTRFGAAYRCLRQLGFGLIDMAWHTITSPVDDEVAFEREACRSVALFDDVDGALISPQFGHIFSGGYAAGYYSYKWAEVLDADAFALFETNGVFDADTARRFKSCILERGGTEHPATLYRRFRGQDATIDALLRRDGIK